MNTQTMPLISFIIPYYNVPLPLVMECVESIARLRLGAEEREIIVVDDGSDADISRELSTVCGDIVYIRQTNGGLSDARNTGIDAAKGEYIQFVDADDRIVTAVYDGCVEKLRAARPTCLCLAIPAMRGIRSHAGGLWRRRARHIWRRTIFTLWRGDMCSAGRYWAV